jgi:uncharacterized protein (DUF934 family)
LHEAGWSVGDVLPDHIVRARHEGHDLFQWRQSKVVSTAAASFETRRRT